MTSVDAGPLEKKGSLFLGPSYFESLATLRETDTFPSRMLITSLGASAVGPVIERLLPTNLAITLNSINALKVLYALRNLGSLKAKFAAEKADKQHWDVFSCSIKDFAETNGSFTVMQVGAHDGKSKDRMHPLFMDNPNWHAVLVEPVPETFARLKANYSERPNTTLVNAAVTNANGPVTMYCFLQDRTTPMMIDGSATTKPRTLSIFQNAGFTFAEEEVHGLTLPAVIDKAKIKPYEIDLLFIDAEGCDADIIGQAVSTMGMRPQYIVCEHGHMLPEEKRVTLDLLISCGYDVMESTHDWLANKINSGEEATSF